MPAPTGSIFSTKANQLQEVINKSVGIYLPTFDKVWEDTIVSSQNVGSSGDMGRDWLINRTYSGGLTGVIDPGGPGSDFSLYGDPSNTAIGSKLFTQGLARSFPDATQGANQASYRLSIPMRSMVANIMVTLGELQAEATDAFIGEVIAPKMEGFARHMTQLLCNYFYLSQNNYYSLTSLAGNSGTGWDKTADSNATLMVDTRYSNYAIDRLMVGMRVQFYDATGATLRTTTSMGASTIFFITAVDELSGKVYCRPVNGVADVNTASFANTDIMVLANSKGSASTPYAVSPYFTGIAGINSWLKFGDSNGSTDNADNCLLGGERSGNASDTRLGGNINVNVHPEFKSMGYNLAGQPLTEHVLRQVLRRFHVAKGKYGQIIDTVIGSDGVWLAYEAQKIGRQFYERTGRLSSLQNEGSKEGFVFEFDGRRYEGATSTYVESGSIYGIRKSNNWTRYVPPDPKGVKKFEKAPSWSPFKFVGAALTGTGSNQIPIFNVANNRTLVTEGVQMPGYLRMQLVPTQCAGLKITNAAEDRVYGTNTAGLV